MISFIGREIINWGKDSKGGMLKMEEEEEHIHSLFSLFGSQLSSPAQGVERLLPLSWSKRQHSRRAVFFFFFGATP